MFLPNWTPSEKKRKDCKTLGGDSSKKSQRNRTEQNYSHNKFNPLLKSVVMDFTWRILMYFLTFDHSLEETIRAKKMLATMSHEIRSPLFLENLAL